MGDDESVEEMDKGPSGVDFQDFSEPAISKAWETPQSDRRYIQDLQRAGIRQRRKAYQQEDQTKFCE